MLLETEEQLHSSIKHTWGTIPHCRERDRYGERIGTGFVESPLNQEAKLLLKELS
jgi:hypothetical protein